MSRRAVGATDEAARSLRRRQTSSERALWDALRARQMDGWKFRRQHPVGPFVLDFYCHAARLAIEVDGAVHDRPGVPLYDADRQQYIEARRIRVLRFRAADVERDIDTALRVIRATLSRSAGEGGGEGAGEVES